MKTVLALTALALASTVTIVMAAPGPMHRGAMIERLRAADANADGLLSRAEVASMPRLAENFDAIDANRDGNIAFEELRAFHAKKRGERFIQRLDTDRDGKVSQAEALAAAQARFDRADANKDGFLTADELAALRHGRGRFGNK